MSCPPMLRLAVLLAAASAAFSPARAFTVQGDGASRTLDCADDDVVVEGNSNDLTFSGNCRGLTVRGDDNAIALSLMPGAPLDVQGNANHIHYTPGAPPTEGIAGSNNEVRLVASPPPLAPPIALVGDGHELELDCTGRDVVISGNRSRYTLRGFCRSLVANGDGNVVRAGLAAGASATVEGNDCILLYAVAGGGEADVKVRGERSRATQEGAEQATAVSRWAPPPPKPQPLPMIPTPAGDTVPLPAPLAQQAAPAPETPAEPAGIAPGTPRLPALLRTVGAKVVATGTAVAVTADGLFQPGTDTLRQGGDTRLREILQLADLIHPNGARLTVTDPADTDLATRRAEALGAWFTARGLPVGQADVSAGVPVGAVEVLLAR